MTVRKRTPHGALAASGETVAYEVTSDPLRPVDPALVDPVERRADGTVTPEGARALVRRRYDLARLPDFAEHELEFIPLEAFKPFEEARRELTTLAGSELATRYGGLCRRTWTIVRGACWLTALAEYWAVRAATTGDPEAADRAARLFAKASIEQVKAEELAQRGAQARSESSNDPPPWLRQKKARSEFPPATDADVGSGAPDAPAVNPDALLEVSAP